MQRLAPRLLRLSNPYLKFQFSSSNNNFTHAYQSSQDLGNSVSYMTPLDTTQNIQDLSGKLDYVSPSFLYHNLDEFTRVAMEYIANDLGLGLGMSIVIISFAIKGTWLPIGIAVQSVGMKMKLLEPETKNFQNTTQRCQRMGDYAGVREAQKSFKELRDKHGIKQWLTMLQLTQLPILITWFLSLRYVTQLPDLWPGLKTEGLLWFKDLSEMDPYFVLPLANALFSYYNISLNPNMSNVASQTVFGRYIKYFRFFPVFALPIIAFFPSGVNIYWTISAGMQLGQTLAIRNEWIQRNVLRIPQYLPGTMLEKANSATHLNIIKTVNSDHQKVKMSEEEKQTQEEKFEEKKQAFKSSQVKLETTNGEAVKVFSSKPKKIKHQAK